MRRESGRCAPDQSRPPAPPLRLPAAELGLAPDLMPGSGTARSRPRPDCDASRTISRPARAALLTWQQPARGGAHQGSSQASEHIGRPIACLRSFWPDWRRGASRGNPSRTQQADSLLGYNPTGLQIAPCSDMRGARLARAPGWQPVEYRQQERNPCSRSGNSNFLVQGACQPSVPFGLASRDCAPPNASPLVAGLGAAQTLRRRRQPRNSLAPFKQSGRVACALTI